MKEDNELEEKIKERGKMGKHTATRAMCIGGHSQLQFCCLNDGNFLLMFVSANATLIKIFLKFSCNSIKSIN